MPRFFTVIPQKQMMAGSDGDVAASSFAKGFGGQARGGGAHPKTDDGVGTCRQYGGLWLRLANKPYKPYKPRASWCGEQRGLVSAFGADYGVGTCRQYGCLWLRLAERMDRMDKMDTMDTMDTMDKETLGAARNVDRQYRSLILPHQSPPSIKSIIVHFVHLFAVAAKRPQTTSPLIDQGAAARLLFKNV